MAPPNDAEESKAESLRLLAEANGKLLMASTTTGSEILRGILAKLVRCLEIIHKEYKSSAEDVISLAVVRKIQEVWECGVHASTSRRLQAHQTPPKTPTS